MLLGKRCPNDMSRLPKAPPKETALWILLRWINLARSLHRRGGLDAFIIYNHFSPCFCFKYTWQLQPILTEKKFQFAQWSLCNHLEAAFNIAQVGELELNFSLQPLLAQRGSADQREHHEKYDQNHTRPKSH